MSSTTRSGLLKMRFMSRPPGLQLLDVEPRPRTRSPPGLPRLDRPSGREESLAHERHRDLGEGTGRSLPPSAPQNSKRFNPGSLTLLAATCQLHSVGAPAPAAVREQTSTRRVLGK